MSLDSKSTARMGKPRNTQKTRKRLPGGFNAIGDEPAESRSVATVKDASLALLEDNQALKGRQSTDGGERSVTPGHVPLPPPPPSLAPSAQGGGVINLPYPGAARCLPPPIICRPYSRWLYHGRICRAKSAGKSRTSKTSTISRTRIIDDERPTPAPPQGGVVCCGSRDRGLRVACPRL